MRYALCELELNELNKLSGSTDSIDPFSWHYWLRNGGSLPELNPHNPKYELAIKFWQKLPVWLTKIIGPSIVKNMP